MPTINLQLGSGTTLNASAQPGDIAYYIPANSSIGGFQTHLADQDMITIGIIQKIEVLINNQYIYASIIMILYIQIEYINIYIFL